MLRDVLFIVAVIVCVTISLSGSGHPYVAQTWSYGLDRTRYRNRKYPAPHERLPPPLIIDVNGDGTNKMLIATRTPSLILMQAPNADDHSGQPVVIREVSLLGSTRTIGSRHPVSMTSGFLDPFVMRTTSGGGEGGGATGDGGSGGSSGGNRQQFIVVIFKSWQVLCFDHQLRLQWETSASRIQSILSIGVLVHREVAAMVSSISIVPGDRGAIIVGGSMGLRDGVDDGTFEISGARVQEDTDASDSFDHQSEILLQKTRDVYYSKVERAERFMYFAFDGRTGAVRWKRDSGASDGGDGQEDSNEDDIEVASKNNGYRMTRNDLRHVRPTKRKRKEEEEVEVVEEEVEEEKTIMDWRDFRSSVLKSLPHSWSERDDTSFNIAHYSRDRHHRRKATWTSPLKTLHKYKGVGGGGGGGGGGEKGGSGSSHHDGAVPQNVLGRITPPHDESEHVVHPNVVVAHTRRGLEILHLFTGRTVTRLSLPETRFGGGSGMYVDVDGDRVIDHVQAIPGVEDDESFKEQREKGASGKDMDAEDEDAEDDEDGMDVSETVQQKGRNHGRSTHYNVPSCWIQTVSGIPPMEQIWEGTLCNDQRQAAESGGGATMLEHASGLNDDNDHLQRQESDHARVTPPIAIHHVGTLEGRPRAVTPYDVVVSASDGTTTKFDSLGRVVWKTTVGATWHRDAARHVSTEREVDAFHPSTTLMELEMSDAGGGGAQENNRAVLSIGDDHLMLLSLETGELLSRIVLSAPPTNKPVIGDFDNDGLNDIVIVTCEGIYGYSGKKLVRRRFTFILLIFVLMMLLFLIGLHFSGLMEDEDENENDYQGTWRGKGNHRHGVQLKSKRAMD